MQTKAHSMAEVLTGTLTGMVGSWLITYAAIGNIQDRSSAATATVIGCTVWSVSRGWFIRRSFNRLEAHRAKEQSDA